MSVFFGAVIHTAFNVVLFVLVLRSETRFFDVVILAISGTLIEAFLSPYVLPSIILLLAILIMDTTRYEYFPLLSATAGVTMFMKFDIGLAALSVVLVGNVWLYVRNERRLVLASLGSWFLVLIVGGLLLMKNPATFGSFLFGSMQLAIGFGPSMAMNGPWWQLVIVAVVVLSLVVYFFRNMLRNQLSPRLWLSLGFLFFTYKEGIVRQDLHMLVFFGGWALFYGLIYLKERKRVLRMVVLFLLVLLLVAGVRSAQFGTGRLAYVRSVYAPGNLPETIDLLQNGNRASQIFMMSVDGVRNSYSLSPGTIAVLSNHTVDIFPWEVFLAYAYGLRWYSSCFSELLNLYNIFGRDKRRTLHSLQCT